MAVGGFFLKCKLKGKCERQPLGANRFPFFTTHSSTRIKVTGLIGGEWDLRSQWATIP